jgi:5-(aminomethyl)-3-furanmethanol phosphate kinase
MVAVDAVVKVGGALLANILQFDAVLDAIAAASRTRRLVVVPGGGPFADTVRETDQRLGLTDTAAHWMAVLAMDQYAHLIAARLVPSQLATDPAQIEAAFSRSAVPVLAPSQWLRDEDPLPHTWDVTSDSIAAWIAGRLGSRALILVKPAGATAGTRVDAFFNCALPRDVRATIIPADDLETLRMVMEGP